MTLPELIFKNFLEPFAYLVYAIIFLLKIYNETNVEQKVLLVFYVVATILLTAASVLVLYANQNVDNVWMYNIFYLLTICVLSWFFYRLLYGRLKRAFIKISLAANVIIFIIYDIILHHFVGSYNGYVYAICYISIVAYSFMYFNQLLANVTEKSILNNFNFWLVSGYLFNYLGAFIIILLYRTVDLDDTGNVWAMQNIILFLSALITLAGYLRTSRRKRYFWILHDHHFYHYHLPGSSGNGYHFPGTHLSKKAASIHCRKETIAGNVWKGNTWKQARNTGTNIQKHFAGNTW